MNNPQRVETTNGLSGLQYDPAYECPGCGQFGIYTKEIERHFPYGEAPATTMLVARVPLRSCKNCSAEFFDEEADERQHAAICRHRRLMTPAEIQTLRETTCGLSRAHFCELTKLGIATVARWERGELVQNAAYDQLLYLMHFPENVDRLRTRFTQNIAAAATPEDIEKTFPDLASEGIDRKVNDEKSF